jgi:hypothetical protein
VSALSSRKKLVSTDQQVESVQRDVPASELYATRHSDSTRGWNNLKRKRDSWLFSLSSGKRSNHIRWILWTFIKQLSWISADQLPQAFTDKYFRIIAEACNRSQLILVDIAWGGQLFRL